MKKFYLVILVILLAFAGSAFAAGDINDVNSEKWLDHVAQMQVMRQQILRLLTKENPTVEDREMLNALQKSFTEQKAAWDQYLYDAATGKSKESKQVKNYCGDCGKVLCECGKGILCKKCDKRICNCSKACEPSKKTIKQCTEKKPYHRYDKSYRHSCASAKMNCGSCSSKKQAFKCNEGVDCKKCPAYKTSKCCKVSGKCSGHKKAKMKMHKKACKTACASKKPAFKCNEGVDCKKCPAYKTSKCCKVSGKCSTHKDCAHKSSKMKMYKKTECPVCKEYRLLKINRKCAKCSK
jgi:hypothetical protein